MCDSTSEQTRHAHSKQPVELVQKRILYLCSSSNRAMHGFRFMMCDSTTKRRNAPRTLQRNRRTGPEAFFISCSNRATVLYAWIIAMKKRTTSKPSNWSRSIFCYFVLSRSSQVYQMDDVAVGRHARLPVLVQQFSVNWLTSLFTAPVLSRLYRTKWIDKFYIKKFKPLPGNLCGLPSVRKIFSDTCQRTSDRSKTCKTCQIC